MVNTTLDIAEAESGAAKLDVSRIDLVDMVHDACDIFRTVAEDNGIVICTALPERCPFEGDLQRLQRVLANLLDNALKCTPEGGRVTVGIVDDGREIGLSVADTGVGIPPQDLKRIFDRFYRCDRSRPQGGVGLGLSLAKAYTDAMNGFISVTSSVKKGSTFELSFVQ